MKKYQYLASWDDQTLTRVGEPVVVLGDSNVSQVEVTLPSDFLLDPTKAECRMYFLLPGEKESAHDVLETAVKDKNGDSHVTWTIKHVHSQKGGRLAFSLTLIGDDAQWDSRTAIIPVYESRYQPESEEAEEPYTGRLTALEGSMASIRGEFAEVQDDFEELKETATLGTPIPESLVANMQEGHVYIYTGTEPGYTAGHVYYYVGGALTDGGVYGGTAVDATLTVSGAAADAKKTGDEISAIKEDLSAVSGLSEEAKQALLACFAKVAWTDEHGQDYYDALEDALYPPTNLVRISAVYTQSGTVYVTDSLDSLKSDLVVTAHYSDGTSGIVTGYTLSGNLAEGTSTVTVSYGGKTATFDVAVSRYRLYDYIYNSSTASGNIDYTNYVDTGLTYAPSLNTLNVEFEAMNSNDTSRSDGIFASSGAGTTNTGYMLWYSRVSKGGFSAYNLGVAKQLTTVPADTRAIIKYFYVDGGMSYMQWGDTVVDVATLNKTAITTNTIPLVLAGAYSTDVGRVYGLNPNGKTKLGYIKFSDPSTNDVLYHFIPAHDLQADKWGFYEQVNDVFYAAAGTNLRCANWEG